MGFNILVVDDSKTTRGMIIRVLKKTEIPLGDIWEAGNGREGLAMIAEHWVDLVLADLNMPEMTGSEMIEIMHKDPVFSKIPVVVISSEGEKSVLESLNENGVMEIVRKPFTPVILKDIVERTLGVEA